MNINAPGYCDSQLSCSGTKFELQCQPSSFGMTSTCTCTQYYQGAGAGGFAGTGGASGGSVGGVSGLHFEVNFGDCQTALNYCSGTPTALPRPSHRGGSKHRSLSLGDVASRVQSAAGWMAYS